MGQKDADKRPVSFIRTIPSVRESHPSQPNWRADLWPKGPSPPVRTCTSPRNRLFICFYYMPLCAECQPCSAWLFLSNTI